jgi:hypothetical protein
MSARLNMNAIRYFPWKGRTFAQVTSIITKNKETTYSSSAKRYLFNARPLKIYRREIATVTAPRCSRVSVSIDELNQPNGYLLPQTSTYSGLVNTLDFNLTGNTSERSTPACNTSANCMSQSANALKRVRSSGMIKRKYNLAKNNDTYYTSTSQYLTSRNRTFVQNQYNFIRQGDSTAKPGTNAAINNIYSANGVTHCKLYKITTGVNDTFSYRWIDYGDTSIDNLVTIPDGYYDIDMLNSIFKKKMLENNHFYYSTSTGARVFLLNIAFNTYYNKVELQCFPRTKYSTNPQYLAPSGVTWDNSDSLIGPVYLNVPVFVIPDGFVPVIGFTAANYPDTDTSVEQHLISNTAGGLVPTYVPVSFKPNNAQFSQQGAVTASARLLRKKYDTITKVGAGYRTAYGSAMANSLAYGVPTGGYNIKEKIGFPLTNTPKILANGTVLRC